MGKEKSPFSVQLLKNQQVIADKCHVAESFWERFVGLIGRSGLEVGEGLFFPGCNSVHMWFMRIAIDVVFLRSETGSDGMTKHIVTSMRENLRPWRPHPATDLRAMDALELATGAVKKFGIQKGDEILISAIGKQEASHV